MSQDGLGEEVEVLLTLPLEKFDEAGVWISSASLTDVATLVEDYFLDDLSVD